MLLALVLPPAGTPLSLGAEPRPVRVAGETRERASGTWKPAGGPFLVGGVGSIAHYANY